MSDDKKLSERMGLQISNHLNQLFPGFDRQTHEEIVAIIEGVLADTPIMKHELLRCELKESKAEIERLWAEVERLEARLADVDPHYHEYKM